MREKEAFLSARWVSIMQHGINCLFDDSVVKCMNLVKGNINLTNEIIDSVKPGENNDTLNDLFNTLASMEPKLFNLIG